MSKRKKHKLKKSTRNVIISALVDFLVGLSLLLIEKLIQ